MCGEGRDGTVYRVLIVEDDPMVAMINEQYVNRSKGFHTVGKCRNGSEALEFLKSNEADLIVMDVYMPQMDGFETLCQIRNNHISIEAIMVTAANDRDSLDKALQLGVIDYLVKPFTFERFRIALDKYAAQATALRELDTLNQKNIDFIIDRARKKTEDAYPKGIQQKTLRMITEHMEKNAGRWMTGDEIADQISLTSVTVRRYLNYLAEAGNVIAEMNYETGGRPCMLYKLTAREK